MEFTWILLTITLVFGAVDFCQARKYRKLPSHYTAAVYEHAYEPSLAHRHRTVTTSRPEAWRIMKKNLDVYAAQVKKAAEKGADIIVFPEDGLYGAGFSRVGIEAYLEVIPDPSHELNPCTDYNETLREQRPVQHMLSCLARNNSIYIVANMGEIKNCTGQADCPKDNHWQFNTNAVFGEGGELLARHRKRNLYNEKQFDKPHGKEANLDQSIFSLRGIRFATFTCFDILFKSPSVYLVQELGIHNIAFTTAWMNKYPFLYAPSFHQGWAITQGVNLLAAELHFPALKFSGSGIYLGADGSVTTYFNMSDDSGGKLLIAKDVPSRPQQPIPAEIKDPMEPRLNVTSTVVFHDNHYSVLPLEQSHGTLSVKQGNTTCELHYKMDVIDADSLYVLAVFDGLHSSATDYYIQVCGIMKCSAKNLASCGKVTTTAKTVFGNFRLRATFTTEYIYPMVIADSLDFVSPKNYTYHTQVSRCKQSKGTLMSRNVKKGLVTAALYGRVYAKDTGGAPDIYCKGGLGGADQDKKNGGLAIGHKFVIAAVVIIVLVIAGIIIIPRLGCKMPLEMRIMYERARSRRLYEPAPVETSI